jgi:hypothetical protein
MSWNVKVTFVEESEAPSPVVLERSMLLTRASQGITHSAVVSKGDVIVFGDVVLWVWKIVHHYQPHGSDVAPVSVALCAPVSDTTTRVRGELTAEDISKLYALGFKDC